ncbi:unnamed protein product [Arctogadus glacialis]
MDPCPGHVFLDVFVDVFFDMFLNEFLGVFIGVFRDMLRALPSSGPHTAAGKPLCDEEGDACILMAPEQGVSQTGTGRPAGAPTLPCLSSTAGVGGVGWGGGGVVRCGAMAVAMASGGAEAPIVPRRLASRQHCQAHGPESVWCPSDGALLGRCGNVDNKLSTWNVSARKHEAA